MKKSLLALFLSLIGMTAMAQSKFNVSGTIIEEETNEPVLSATVRILSLPDSAMVTGAATNVNGMFNVKDVKKGKYAVKITYIGFQERVFPLDLTKQNSKDVNMGYIHLKSDSKLLKEAQVSAAAAKVQVSGDSLVYNASAIRTAEGSMLEDLVKRLPGATMESDGTIKINGKEVKKILVDGKEFFLNDKEMALKNIPTNIVDKIKSYDKKSDLSRVTGIDDGEEETVLDLSLKKGMNQGWFGNIDLGGGTESRYSTRLNVNRFADQNQYSIIGNLNNVGGMGFGGGGGRWGNFGGFGGGGLRTNKDVGGNFVAGNDKIEMGGSIRYRYNGNDTRTESNSINFVTPNGAYTTSMSQNYGSNYNLNAQFKVEWKPDSMTNIIFRPSGTISRNRSMSASANGTYNENPYDLYEDPLNHIDETFARLDSIIVNSNISDSQNYSLNKSANGELQVNRRLNNEGRNVTLRATGSISNSDSEQLSAASVRYKKANMSDTYNNRYYNTPGRNHSYSAQLTYSEPIAYKTYLQFSYRYNYSYSKNDRQAGIFYDAVAYNDIIEALSNHRYDVAGALDEIISNGLLPDYQSEEARKLSQFSEYRNYNHTVSVSYRKVRDAYNFSIGLDFLPQHSKLNYKYMGKEYPEITRTVYNFAPSVDFRYNFDKQTNIRVNYRSRTSQPSMTNLLDITDDSNPLNITKGNPGLKPSLNHNINFNFNTYNAEIQQGIFAYGGGGFSQNDISNRTWYDEATGVRTTKPENINGNWNARLGFGWNRGFGPDRLFTVSSNTNGGYNHRVSYLDPTRYTDDISATNTITVGENLSFGYRKDWFEASVNGNVNYNNSKNNIVTTNNRSTWDFSYGADFNLMFNSGTSISTDISESSRRGYSSKDMNTNELLWNIQVSQSFLKGKALTISLQWNDILRQQSNISRTISAMAQSDSRSNAIYSYGMLHVIYKLNIFGKGSKGPQMGGFGGRGGFPGGGFGGGWGGGRPF